MRNIITLLSILLILGTACSSDAAQNAASNAKSAVSSSKDPNKLGTQIFESLQSNNKSKFKQAFIRESLYGEFEKMLTSVELSAEQKAATMGFVNQTLGFWSKNNGAAAEGLFDKIRQQGFDQGIDWKKTELTKVESGIKQVTDFQMYLNVHDVYVTFKDQNQVSHQILLPRNYELSSGIYAGDASYYKIQ